MESKEKLKELLTKVKDDEQLVQKYIDTFNECFEIEKENDPNVNVLECIFINFINLAYKPTETNKFILSELVEVQNELFKTFTNEQKSLFDIYDFLQYKYSEDYALKGFVYAYCLGKELNNEVQNFKRDNKQLQEQIQELKKGSEE